MKARISIAIRYAVSIFLLGLLVWLVRDSASQVLIELKKVNLGLFFLAFLLFVLLIPIASYRLKLIFADERLSISLKDSIELTYIGYFFNNFMPTAVGGDIVKAYYVAKNTNQKAKSFICVFMDRFIGLFSFVALGAATLAFSWNSVTPEIRSRVLVALFISFLAIAAITNRIAAKIFTRIFSTLKFARIGERLANFYKIIHDYRNKKSLLLKAAVFSVTTQIIYFVMIYVLTMSLNVPINIGIIFLLMPIVGVISVLPSIGGLGLREMSIVVLFRPFIGEGNALSLSLLLLGVLILISALGGIIYLVSPQFRMQDKKFAEDEDMGI